MAYREDDVSEPLLDRVKEIGYCYAFSVEHLQVRGSEVNTIVLRAKGKL